MATSTPDPQSGADSADPVDVLATWLERTPFHPRTRESYEREVTLWINWVRRRTRYTSGPGEPAWKATPRQVDAWAGKPGRTRAHRVAAVRSFYTHAEQLGLVTANPALTSLRGSVDGLPGRRLLTPRQSEALVDAADHAATPYPQRDRALIYMLLSGFRPGQVTALLLEHLHPEQHRLTADMPQKGGGTRLVVIPDRAAGALEEYTAEDPDDPARPYRAHKAPHSYKDRGPVFTSRNGRALSDAVTLLDIVRKVAAAHPELERVVHEVTLDGIAHSPSPWRPAGSTDSNRTKEQHEQQ